MLTNNGKALCFCSDYWDYTSGGVRYHWNPRYVLQRTNGITATIERNSEQYPEELCYSNLCNNLDIILGTGTTPAAVADYNLENQIISTNLQVVSKSSRNAENCDSTYDNAPIIFNINKTFYNSSLLNSITINELGVITKDGYGYSYLLYRKVFDEPQILAPDSNITFSVILS